MFPRKSFTLFKYFIEPLGPITGTAIRINGLNCCSFPEPYTVREARIHVRHVRDLLKSVGYHDAYAGMDCNSVSLLNIVTNGNILG